MNFPTFTQHNYTCTWASTSSHHSNGNYKKKSPSTKSRKDVNSYPPHQSTSNQKQKQKIKNLYTIIKLGTPWTYYASPFSKPNIKKLDKLLNESMKEICNIPKSTMNILTHLHHEHFAINTTSLLQHLIQALNNPRQLGTIYQGLTKIHHC